MFQLLSAKKNIVLNVKQVLLLKKLLKILPSLKRFFNISKTKLIQSVDVFMRKIIDLKFKRSFKVFFNLVYKNYIFSNSKKLAYATKKKWQRLEKYLGGISNMIKFSKKAIYNNVAIIVGGRAAEHFQDILNEVGVVNIQSYSHFRQALAELAAKQEIQR